MNKLVILNNNKKQIEHKGIEKKSHTSFFLHVLKIGSN